MVLVRLGCLAIALGVAIDARAATEELWQVVDRDGGFVVEERPTQDGSVWIRGSAELPFSAVALRSVLMDLSAFPEWVRRLSRWDILENSPAGAIVYGRHDFPWPIADRDYVVRYTWTDAGAPSFRLDARALEKPPIEPIDGVVRLLDLATTWEVESLGTRSSRVAYTYRGSLGGVAGVIGRLTRGAQLRESFERLADRAAQQLVED